MKILYRQKGVAAVELALIIVPMLVLCFGIVEVGRALYYYNGIVKATRGAARYLTGKDLNANYAADVARARKIAVCGTSTCDDTVASLVPGLTRSKVFVVIDPYRNIETGKGAVSLLTVSISGVTFEPMLPFGTGPASFPYGEVKITMAWSAR
jgi:Flp pilus assembly protein TadG